MLWRYIIIILGVFLLVKFLKNYFEKREKKNSLISENDTLDEKFNAYKKQKQIEIDTILDKVASKGLSSLTMKERQILDDYSSKK